MFHCEDNHVLTTSRAFMVFTLLLPILSPLPRTKESQIVIPAALLMDIFIHPKPPSLHTLYCHLNDSGVCSTGLSICTVSSSPLSSSASVGSQCLCCPLWRLPERCRGCCTKACSVTRPCCVHHQSRKGPSSPFIHYILSQLSPN